MLYYNSMKGQGTLSSGKNPTPVHKINTAGYLSVQCTVYSVQCTVYCVQFTVSSTQCTVCRPPQVLPRYVAWLLHVTCGLTQTFKMSKILHQQDFRRTKFTRKVRKFCENLNCNKISFLIKYTLIVQFFFYIRLYKKAT